MIAIVVWVDFGLFRIVANIYNPLSVNAFGLTVECFICLNRSKISTGSAPISTIEFLLIFILVYAFLPPIKTLIKFITRITISIWEIILFSFLFFLTKKETKKTRLWISILFANHNFTTMYNSSRTILTSFWNWNFSKMFLQKF